MSKRFSHNWRVIGAVSCLLAAVMVILPGCGTREPPLDKKTVIREFNKLYYYSNLQHRAMWMGIQTMQNPCDMWMMQEIITKIKPDFIVETGTANGGSTLFFAMLQEQLNKNGKVITVDIDPKTEGVSEKFNVFRERVEVITGDSASPEVADKIAKQVQGHVVLVTLDSLHTKDHVLKELKLYSKLVSIDSYLIVQDTNLNGHPVYPNWGPGPMEAVEEFLMDNKDFEINRSMERHMLTSYPSGYLKRVR